MSQDRGFISDPESLGGSVYFVGTRVPVTALLDYLEGGHPLADFLVDYPTVTREQAVGVLNRGGELLRRLRMAMNSVESRARDTKVMGDLRGLLATLRDLIDLHPSVVEEDYLWNTAGAFGLQRVAGTLPKVVTRGSILIKDGIVHRKAPLVYRCPDCGGELTRTETVVRFVHASAELAEQRVPAYECECGEVWPDPRAMRGAHRSAFGL
jgi:uncharacterized protein (DUF433 family)